MRPLPPESLDGDAWHWQLVVYDPYSRCCVELQESVRRMRGTSPAQIPDAKISVRHDAGAMFAAFGDYNDQSGS